MTDLFNEKEAHATTNKAIECVRKGANKEWIELMYDCVVAIALSQLLFTSDDVFALANQYLAQHKAIFTPDKRAFGWVMRKAQRDGICYKEPVPAIPSQRKNIHRSLCTVWHSKIYGSAK